MGTKQRKFISPVKSLEQEGMIQVRKRGKRSKITFELTDEGKQMLLTLKGKKKNLKRG